KTKTEQHRRSLIQFAALPGSGNSGPRGPSNRTVGRRECMSGRAATPTPNRSARAGRFPLAVGLFVVGLAAVATAARAQDEIDDRRPLPPAEPKRPALLAKFAIPNRDAAILQGRTDAQGAPT